MKFTRKSKWYEQSDCGKYTVASAHVIDRYLFSAFFGNETIGCYDTADEARQCCAIHAGNP